MSKNHAGSRRLVVGAALAGPIALLAFHGCQNDVNPDRATIAGTSSVGGAGGARAAGAAGIASGKGGAGGEVNAGSGGEGGAGSSAGAGGSAGGGGIAAGGEGGSAGVSGSGAGGGGSAGGGGAEAGGEGGAGGGSGSGGAAGCGVGEQLCQGTCAKPGDKLCVGLTLAFSDAWTSGADGRSIDVAFADFDKNGALDMFATYSPNGGVGKCSMWEYFGDGSGSFPLVQKLNGECGEGVIAFDVDNDGNQDVLYGADDVFLLRGNGNGSFKAAQLVAPKSAMAFWRSDLDGDGTVETAWMRVPFLGDGNISVFSNQNGSLVSVKQVATGFDKPVGLAVVPDEGKKSSGFAVVDVTSSIRLLPMGGSGAASYAPSGLPTQFDPTITFVKLDVGGVVVTTAADAKKLLLARVLNGALSAVEAVPVSVAPRSVSVGDMNADGFQDLIVATDQIEIWTGDGKGNFLPGFKVGYAAGHARLVAIDLNNDKLLDLVIWGDDFVRVHLNQSK